MRGFLWSEPSDYSAGFSVLGLAGAFAAAGFAAAGALAAAGLAVAGLAAAALVAINAREAYECY
jgi:hypothetical protein